MRRYYSCSNLTILLVLSALWLFLGEVGIYYVYSWKWYWPELGISTEDLEKYFTRENLQGVTGDLHLPSERYHYQNGDSHYYSHPVHSKHAQEEREVALKVLFMSDPHIMCTFNKVEPWFARRDADGYLSVIYSHLIRRLSPDVVIFLGDVFSDGFQASDEEWTNYLACLERVFPRPSPEVKRIVAFGDNDVGGEGRDYMTGQINKRYIKAFGDFNTDQTINGVQFIKLTTVCWINKLPRTTAEEKCRTDLASYVSQKKQSLQENQKPRIVLSHVPLHQTHTRTNQYLRDQVLKVKPNYVISGHIHHQRYSAHVVSGGENGGNRSSKKLIHEMTVPTCSYRMGKQFMGVGVAVISSGGDLAYRVLWLPQRYPFLISYSILIFILFLVILCRFKCK